MINLAKENAMKIKLLLSLLGLFLALASCTKRKPEEIDLAPNSPWNPYPPDSSNNIDHTTLDVTLHWSATDPNSGDVLTYDVYLDTINPPLTNIASGLSAPSSFVTGLKYNTTYFWNVYVTDAEGVTTASRIWRFTTLPHANDAPNVPSYLYPTNGAAWQYPTLNLAWDGTDPQGSSDTLYYDVYLGLTPQPSLTLFKNYTSNLREFTGLNYTATYYWKIVVHDNHGAYTSGPVYSFVTRDCPWFFKHDLPSARYGFGTAVVNGRIYVIGGNNGTSELAEVLEYDPLLDSWTRKADMPTSRSELAVTVWNNKIYALGGRNNTSFFGNNEVYDPLLDAWDSLTPLPFPGYGGINSAYAVKGKIFTQNPVFQYNIATNDWWDTMLIYADTVAPDTIYVDTFYDPVMSVLPHSNLYYCSAVYNNLIYVMGGTNWSSLLPFVDVYHPGTNEWTTAADMISPANFSAALTANGFIYVLGGYDDTYSKKVRKYDPVTDTWFIRSDLQAGRSCLGAAYVNSNIFAIGGLSPLPRTIVEEYQLDLDPKNARR
jgi:hypothetical protein